MFTSFLSGGQEAAECPRTTGNVSYASYRNNVDGMPLRGHHNSKQPARPPSREVRNPVIDHETDALR